jgi:hypothetical protein
MCITRTQTATLCLLSMLIGAAPARLVRAEDAGNDFLSPVAIGLRFGTNDGTQKNSSLDRVDLFASWRTPYAWEFSPGWDIGARLNASVGAMGGQQQLGAVGTFVPTLAIGDTDNVVSFEIGAGGALFSQWEYGTVEDFGGPFQFVLDIGINFRVYKELGLGYRYQHWSDAGMYGAKRGVDMNMLELSYRY